ncbi:tyrosine-protein phosphatase non-receptor type 22 [Aplochiton taeniatus]
MEQQAAILRSLLAQLEMKEAEDEETESGYGGEFMRLKTQSTKYRTDKTYPSKAAEKQDNIKKNRYKDIVPFDHSRVKLSVNSSKKDSDYINANFIKGVSGTRAYIATQGPLPHTVLDFWRMIWEYNIKVIVMACREFEMGRKKCERYSPAIAEEPFVCEPFTVCCESEENKGDYVTRTLRVTYCNCTRALLQLHYVNWPDHGVPDSIPPILEMLQDMRSYQDHDDVPICIHCSAGCGRTGALCAIDYTWNLIRRQMIRENFSIFDLVQSMRTQRPSVVQTKEQYVLVCRTIRFLFERYLQSMDVPACPKEESGVSALSPAESDSELSDLSEEFEPETLLKFEPGLEQRLVVPSSPMVDYNLGPWYDTGPQIETTKPFSSCAREMDRLRRYVQPSTSQGREGWPGLSAPSRASQCLGPEFSHRAPEPGPILDKTEELLPLKNAAAHVPPICLTVEDPYFGPESPMCSPTTVETPWGSPEGHAAPGRNPEQPTLIRPTLTLNDQTLELRDAQADGPGPVVPASDDDAAPPLPFRTPESFQLAPEAGSPVGSGPPSPVPSLPERTPESFELAAHQAPVECVLQEKAGEGLSRLVTSPECSGDSGMTSPQTTKTARARTCDSLTPPLPERTPESFILVSQDVSQSSAPCLQAPATAEAPWRIGSSSEWAGISQPKSFMDGVMNRSKTSGAGILGVEIQALERHAPFLQGLRRELQVDRGSVDEVVLTGPTRHLLQLRDDHPRFSRAWQYSRHSA